MANVKNPKDLNVHKITVRLNQNDYDSVKDIAETQHISMSELFRLLLLNKLENRKIVNLSESDRAELINSITQFWNYENDELRNLRNIGNNINQIAKKYNTTSSDYDSEFNRLVYDGLDGLDSKPADKNIEDELVKVKAHNDELINLLLKVDKGVTKLWQQLE